MLWNQKKFNKEIKALNSLPKESSLHPLRKEQIKQAIMAEINSPVTEKETGWGFGWKERNLTFIRYIIASILGLSLVGGTTFASSNSLPGDTLYPIKQIKEKIEISLKVSAEAKAKLQSQFAEERLKELSRLRMQNPPKATLSNSQQINNQSNENEAKINLQNAIETLTTVKENLEAKGNTQAASSVGQTLLRLEGRHEGGVEVEINHNSTSTSGQSQVKIKTEEPKNEPGNENKNVKGIKTDQNLQTTQTASSSRPNSGILKIDIPANINGNQKDGRSNANRKDN